MIDHEHLAEYVEQELPELHDLHDKSKCKNVYDIMHQMVNYTIDQVIAHNMAALRRCFDLAARLYKAGNSVVRNAIENVYVYSFSQAFCHDEAMRREVVPVMPAGLYELYKKQVVNSHL